MASSYRSEFGPQIYFFQFFKAKMNNNEQIEVNINEIVKIYIHINENKIK